NLNL
ncbi:2-dehydro-3-deoxyphosphooctonate aldolase, partial [Vibrio parahaemolyticus V-223/04]